MSCPVPFSSAVAQMKRRPVAMEMERLHAAWQRTFLNYTPDAPGQWTDPDGEYSGDFSRPELAVPFLRLLALTPDGLVKYRDTIQTYIEFAAAVWRETFTPQQCALFLEYLLEVKADMPDVAYYAEQLAEALRKAVSA